jgi:hypothetical protein
MTFRQRKSLPVGLDEMVTGLSAAFDLQQIHSNQPTASAIYQP